jgi:general stress protein 26
MTMKQGEKINTALEAAHQLVNRSKFAMMGTIGEDSFPNIKAMIIAKHEGLREVWFKTNTSSRRITQVQLNNKTCVYFVDFETWEGLMLIGRAEIRRNRETRETLWKDGSERYYPLGVDDPDYVVLRFVAEVGNYYHGLVSVTFLVAENQEKKKKDKDA